ncbi:MAG: endolytic transglycosylase MltG, partial [Gammaproteobacteria bacterium]|nr:endolytic transglycosylase MltG [Gammaproteobacteria bacterium]
MSNMKIIALLSAFKMRWLRWPKAIRIITAVAALSFCTVTIWGAWNWQQLDSVLLKGNSRLYTVAKGAKAKDVLMDLAAEPVSPFWSVIWLKLHPEFSQIKAGTYKIEKGWNVKHALLVFVSGKEAVFSVTLIEGQRIEDWLQILSRAPYLEQPLTPDDLISLRSEFDIEQENIEGWFLPETYSYTVGTTSREILRRAHNEMKHFLEKNWNNRDKSVPYESPYEALVMASIIEKETGKDNERPRIASVFVNRLNKKMKLQTDPTVIY